jgi:hypothetical protein
MTKTGKCAPVPYTRKRAAKRRLSVRGRLLVGYLTFFAISLLIFDALVLVSLLP